MSHGEEVSMGERVGSRNHLITTKLISPLKRRCHGCIPVYLTAVLECLTAKILELVENAARDNGRTRIIPRQLQLAVHNDEELNEMLRGVTIAQGGVLPIIQVVLLPKKTEKLAKSK
ncbi:histone H2A-like [Nematolebias whitei]|uniref:histone H2A-like n=1 Tax=Nematolebias whitei TaxID=451745 RepID=UPI001896E68A|nr:histone H2A-like [Nematolebias whitei]